MRHDDDRFGHRADGRQPPHRNVPDRLPVPYRSLPPAPAAAQAERARRILVACALVVTAGVAGIMTLLHPAGGKAPDPVAQEIIQPPPIEYQPSVPVSLLPAPTSSFTSPPPPAPPPETKIAHRRAPTGVSQTVSPAPVVDLNVGATVGLEVAGKPGYRVRHRDFIGRVERVGAGSSELDRADSRFVVRKGLAREGCVSLESVNFPGYFLRHREFVLRLEREGRSNMFAEDATFCTSPTRGGAAFTLESVNYPNWALTLHDDGILHLDQNAATAFVARQPL
jgi:hypothetical protein